MISAYYSEKRKNNVTLFCQVLSKKRLPKKAAFAKSAFESYGSFISVIVFASFPCVTLTK